MTVSANTKDSYPMLVNWNSILRLNSQLSLN